MKLGKQERGSPRSDQKGSIKSYFFTCKCVFLTLTALRSLQFLLSMFLLFQIQAQGLLLEQLFLMPDENENYPNIQISININHPLLRKSSLVIVQNLISPKQNLLSN
ncbi:hypothetical protein CDL12_30081 [Handroanthus impetiginosus]|uniref:Uncharacterized protein n=1 Tax=Handroanthus impetiginosus TaxID=429701 RepID=A0A2G9FWL3_9LAMI|nr:hypothetical protein CDL12_30081 [Handroanthus impetiginosus]